MTASMLKMSGRIYNAMMKFAGGTKTAPQLANMFFSNGKQTLLWCAAGLPLLNVRLLIMKLTRSLTGSSSLRAWIRFLPVLLFILVV